MAEIPWAIRRRVRNAADETGLEIASLSATFNMIHPDPAVVDEGLRRLEILAQTTVDLETNLLTLCTGTRDPNHMWHHHPDNATPAAWADLVEHMKRAVEIAERYDVRLGVEPEPGNVMRTARHARQLLDEIGSDHLGVVLDPANLIDGVTPGEVVATIDEAFALVSGRIVLAHGKDRDAAGTVQPAGLGIVPWPHFLAGLTEAGYTGDLILHGLDEQAVPAAVAFLRGIPA